MENVDINLPYISFLMFSFQFEYTRVIMLSNFNSQPYNPQNQPQKLFDWVDIGDHV